MSGWTIKSSEEGSIATMSNERRIRELEDQADRIASAVRRLRTDYPELRRQVSQLLDRVGRLEHSLDELGRQLKRDHG